MIRAIDQQKLLRSSRCGVERHGKFRGDVAIAGAVNDQNRHAHLSHLAHRIELLGHQQPDRQPRISEFLRDIEQRSEGRFDDEASRWGYEWVRFPRVETMLIAQRRGEIDRHRATE